MFCALIKIKSGIILTLRILTAIARSRDPLQLFSLSHREIPIISRAVSGGVLCFFLCGQSRGMNSRISTLILSSLDKVTVAAVTEGPLTAAHVRMTFSTHKTEIFFMRGIDRSPHADPQGEKTRSEFAREVFLILQRVFGHLRVGAL